MRTVRDESGRRYVLLKASDESSLVRDPETGERRHVPNDELTTVAGESPLSTAADAVPAPVRTLVTATNDVRTLGLLVELDERGPLRVRELLGAYDLCESDLHGIATELRAAGLLEEVEVAGGRGYELTDAARAALAAIT
jgi:hypothetical protein